MPVLSVASVKASPGATTLAALLAASWPQACLLVEADESGGVLAPRLGLSDVPSGLQLATEARRGLDSETVQAYVQGWGGTSVLVAPREPQQVTATLRELARPLATVFAGAGRPIGIVDAGRVRPDSVAWPIVERSARLLLVARCRLDEFGPLRARAAEVRAAGVRVGAVLVVDGPYPPDEFSMAADVELVASLPYDERAQELNMGQPHISRRLTRSAIWTAVEALAGKLATEIASEADISANAGPSTT